jgi:hypothetical protein
MRHALRPDGAPDSLGGRPTLCGTRAAVSRMAFEPWLREVPEQRTCRICWAVAERFPPYLPPNPSNDLARARHVVGRLRAVVAGRCTDDEMRRAVGQVVATIEGVLPNPPVPQVPWPGITLPEHRPPWKLFGIQPSVPGGP